MKKHLKRYEAPKHWGLETKGAPFATKPRPGPHPAEMGIPLVGIVRDFLRYARDAREAKMILRQGQIKVDHVVRKDHKFAAGLMDVISIEKTGEHFRILPDRNGLTLSPIPDADSKFKFLRIMGKRPLKGGNIQLNMHDGGNLEVAAKDDQYSVGDVLQVTIPDKKVKDHLRIEPENSAYVYRGKDSGTLGRIEKVETVEGSQPNLVTLSVGEETLRTLKDFIFVVGRKRSKIKVS
jgi:small subunit ribosomal protein S4e